jgi:hypothetical protein
MEQQAYLEKQQKLQNYYESLCKRCGACCGALSDEPCARLVREPDGKYSCSVYAQRIGLQRTVTGKEFHCVPIRDLRPNLPFRGCAYFEHG